MDKNSYRYQQDLKNVTKIRELLTELPGFCREYFLALESRKSTNTRKNYAYDLLTFFHFLQEIDDSQRLEQQYDKNYRCNHLYHYVVKSFSSEPLTVFGKLIRNIFRFHDPSYENTCSD